MWKEYEMRERENMHDTKCDGNTRREALAFVSIMANTIVHFEKGPQYRHGVVQ